MRKNYLLQKRMLTTERLPNYPECGSTYVYEGCGLFICPECGYEWSPAEEIAEEGLAVKDLNGDLSANGDSITVIKDLKVKGASDAIKQGIEVKNIRLMEGDHNIDCKADGFGPMELKSEFVKES